MAKSYDEVLNWALERGAKIHPNIVRQEVDGVWGMFATGPIPRDAVLAMFPKKHGIQVDPAYEYPDRMPQFLKYIHTCTMQIRAGDDTFMGFQNLYPMEELKENRACFFTSEEIEILSQMNVLLGDFARRSRSEVEGVVSAVAQFDPSMDNAQDQDTIRWLYLNSQMRAWDEGFLPVLDMFNHSDKSGCLKTFNADYQILVAGIDYAEGDQIWINYGPKDMYLHALNYGYFDPQGNHFIDIGYRVTQTADNPFQRKLFDYMKGKYPLTARQDAHGHIHYKVQPGKVMLLDNAPTVAAVDFFRDLSYMTQQELKEKQFYPVRFRDRVLQYLDALLGINHVDEVAFDSLPKKMRYFHPMLRKEKQMLINNRDWVLTNSPAEGRPVSLL